MAFDSYQNFVSIYPTLRLLFPILIFMRISAMLSRAQNTFHHNPRLRGPVSSIFNKTSNEIAHFDPEHRIAIRPLGIVPFCIYFFFTSLVLHYVFLFLNIFLELSFFFVSSLGSDRGVWEHQILPCCKIKDFRNGSMYASHYARCFCFF